MLSLNVPVWKKLVELERETRPEGSTRANDLLRKRYETLPDHVKTSNQMLGMCFYPLARQRSLVMDL